MRVLGQSLAALAGAFIVVGLVGGQQPGGGFGKGGGFGGFGGAMQQDAASLLRLDQVKKEINVTDEQVEKIPAAIMKGLSGVLNEKQMTRLRQIELQLKKSNAYLDTSVQAELKITAEQKTSIKTILDDSKKELAEAKGAGGKGKGNAGGGFGANAEKIAAIEKETNEKVDLVLTSDQRRAFKAMLGEEFKLEQPKGFGGQGGKGKKKGAGAD